MKKLFIVILAFILTTSAFSQKNVDILMKNNSEVVKDEIHRVLIWRFVRNYSGFSVYYFKKVSEKEILEWFSKNPKYKYLGITDTSDRPYGNARNDTKRVGEFQYIDLEMQNQRLEREKKREDENKLAHLKEIEQDGIDKVNFDIIKQQVENGTYIKSAQSINTVQNYVWWNTENFNNLKAENSIIESEFGKLKNFKPIFTKDLFTGNEDVKQVIHAYTGTINSKSKLPEGNGNFKIGIGNYYDGKPRMGRPEFEYDGEWTNGKFDGEGKIFDKYLADIYCSYSGGWKNNNYDGQGTLIEAFKDGKVEFLISKGTFTNGKKNGKFEVYGQYRDQVEHKFYLSNFTQALYQKFRYQADVVYENDVVLKYTIVKDRENELNIYFTELARKSREYAKQRKAENCEKCEIDYKKSSYPKEENNFWSGTHHVDGVIVMKNGDKYKFDFEKGRAKVINGFFDMDDYYTDVIKMMTELTIKCKKKYCQ